MMEHKIAVYPHIDIEGKPAGFRWGCSCDATGNVQESHQLAFNLGTQHQWIEAEPAE